MFRKKKKKNERRIKYVCICRDYQAIKKKMGLTQEELAKLMDVSVKTIYRYEHGRVKRYNPSVANKFANVFGVKITFIWKEI